MATPKYDGTDGGPIDLVTAKEWVKRFRDAHPPGEIRSHYFGRDIIDRVLGANGCFGIQVYYALNDKGGKEIIIAGVDDKGNIILPPSSPALLGGGGDGTLADFSWPCPTTCPPGGDL